MASQLSFLLATMALLITTISAVDPLHLSPYIDSGDIQTARDLSLVQEDNIPTSHAGYITVDSDLGNHLFFWFFPNTDPSAPLLLWLDGGPGTSSMVSLFWVHGPLEIVPASGNNGPTFRRRCVNWAKHYSIVYVDNPVGVGFSYSDSGDDGLRTTQDGYSEDLHSFVKQFFQLFSEYQTRDFYVTGLSYAGRYVPALAYRIHQARQNGDTNVPLTGIYMGSPYYDMQNQMVQYFELLYAKGAMSYADRNSNQDNVRRIYQSFFNGQNESRNLVTIFLQLVPPGVGLPSQFNYVTGESPDIPAIDGLLTTSHFRQLLHAGDGSYTADNFTLFALYGNDIFNPATEKLAVLMDNYPTLISSGDLDVVVSAGMVEEALIRTPWTGQCDYKESVRTTWRKEDELLGWYSQTGNLCRVIVNLAGHYSGREQPDVVLKMMRDFTTHGCVQNAENA